MAEDLDFNINLKDSLFKVKESWKFDDSPKKEQIYPPKPIINFKLTTPLKKKMNMLWLRFLNIKNAQIKGLEGNSLKYD